MPKESKFTNDLVRDTVWVQLNRQVDIQVPLFTNKMRKIFTLQKIKTFIRLSGKKFAQKDIEDIKLNIQEETQAIKDEWLNPSIGVVVSTSMQTADIFNFINDTINIPDARAFLIAEINKFAKETTETTNALLAETLIEGIDNGEPIYQLQNRITAVFEKADITRAGMIAKTELTRITTWSNEQIYEKAGVEYKEWLTNPGACEYCRPMNGKIVKIGEPFFKKNSNASGDEGGSLPLKYETVLRPPLHPSCRCDLLPVL